MRSVAIVDDPDRARALAGTLSEYDASAVDPQALEGPGDYDVVVADWDTPVVGRLVTDRDGRSWGVVAVVDDGTETDPVADGAPTSAPSAPRRPGRATTGGPPPTTSSTPSATTSPPRSCSAGCCDTDTHIFTRLFHIYN